jgi:hypothetical protein
MNMTEKNSRKAEGKDLFVSLPSLVKRVPPAGGGCFSYYVKFNFRVNATLAVAFS